MRSESGPACGALVPEQSKVAAGATSVAPQVIISCVWSASESGRQAGRPQAAGEVLALPGRHQAALPVQPSAVETAAWRMQRNLAEKLRTRSFRLTSALARAPARARAGASQHQPAC